MRVTGLYERHLIERVFTPLAAPNNGMHPTGNSAALIFKGSSGRVMPGVRPP